MPLRHGLDVSVISSSHERFTEYGFNTHARSKLVTAKIEARSGVQFYISIRAEDPFPTEQNQRYGSSILTRTQGGSCTTRSSPGPPPAPRTCNSHTDFPTPTPKPPPFDLVVQVYIDGRPNPENRSIVTLNPGSPGYQPEVLLKGRRVHMRSAIGGPTRRFFHDWVFTDVGVDVLFERMGVEDTSEPDARDGEDHEVAGLADMLQDAAKVEEDGGRGVEEGEQELKIGKIEVVFTRVVLGEVTEEMAVVASRSLHDAQREQSAPKMSVGRDVTHTTSIVPSSREPILQVYQHSCIKWAHYNPNEDFYAKFKFDYTARAKLVKWGLCDEAGVPAEKAQEDRKHSRSAHIHTANVYLSEEDRKGESAASPRRGNSGTATEQGKENPASSLKREIARLDAGARTDADPDPDTGGDEAQQHEQAKRRHRSIPLPIRTAAKRERGEGIREDI